MTWEVGAVLDTSDFVGFNIIDATNQRPIVSFSYSSRVDMALENAKHIGVVPPRPVEP